MNDFDTLPKNGEDWGKLIVAKIQNIAQSGHTGCNKVRKCLRSYKG